MAGLIHVNENENITHLPTKDKKNDDMFGMEDEDWDIYRGLNKDRIDEDEEDQENVTMIEKQIAEVDPSFTFRML